MSKNKNKVNKTSKSLSCSRLRLCIKRSLNHIYAQIIDDSAGVTLVSSNSLKLKSKKNKSDAATQVGKQLADLALKKDIKSIYFPKVRQGLRYVGRVKNLCESARSHGLNF